MKPYTVRLRTENCSEEIMKPSDRSSDSFLVRLAQIERGELVDEPSSTQPQAEFSDGFFLFDIVGGLGKIGLELPEDKQWEFVNGAIGRDELLSYARHSEGV